LLHIAVTTKSKDDFSIGYFTKNPLTSLQICNVTREYNRNLINNSVYTTENSFFNNNKKSYMVFYNPNNYDFVYQPLTYYQMQLEIPQFMLNIGEVTIANNIGREFDSGVVSNTNDLKNKIAYLLSKKSKISHLTTSSVEDFHKKIQEQTYKYIDNKLFTFNVNDLIKLNLVKLFNQNKIDILDIKNQSFLLDDEMRLYLYITIAFLYLEDDNFKEKVDILQSLKSIDESHVYRSMQSIILNSLVDERYSKIITYIKLFKLNDFDYSIYKNFNAIKSIKFFTTDYSNETLLIHRQGFESIQKYCLDHNLNVERGFLIRNLYSEFLHFSKNEIIECVNNYCKKNNNSVIFNNGYIKFKDDDDLFDGWDYKLF
jgi:hypothetical protein